MPVDYQAPGAIGLAALYGRGGGGGYGGGGGGPIQQLHDDTGRQQNQLAALGLQGRIESDQMNQRFSAQDALQTHAAEMDAWQFQQKVSEQEQMQRRQDDNSIAAIDQDNTMSPVEKLQAKTRIRSRIDWVDQRQKRDMQEAQATMYKAHADQFKANAALQEQYLQNSAALLQNKTRTIIDPSKTEQIDDYIRSMGIDPNSPQGIPMRDKIAAEEGWTATYPVNEKAVMGTKPIFGFGAQGGTHDVSPGARTATKGAEETAHQNVDHYREAYKLALEDAKLAGNTTVSQADIDKHLAQISGRTPTGQKEDANKGYKETVGKIEVALQQNKDDTASPPGLKSAKDQTLNKIKRLLDQYPPSSNPPKAVLRHIAGLQAHYDQLKQIQVAQKPQQQAEQGQPQEQGRPQLDWGQGFQTDVGNVFRGASRGLVDAGGAIAGAPGTMWDAAKSGNPFPQSWQDYFAR